MNLMRTAEQWTTGKAQPRFRRFWGCQHRHITWPVTLNPQSPRPVTQVSCLDCGRRFSYSWIEMQQGEEIP